jgi:hypothetical protein
MLLLFTYAILISSTTSLDLNTIYASFFFIITLHEQRSLLRLKLYAVACVSDLFQIKIHCAQTYKPEHLFLYFYHIIMDLQLLSPVPTVNVKSNRMETDDETIHLVNPGEVVTTDQQFMR